MDMGRGKEEYIGFDLDGVLVPWHERITKYGIEKLGWPKNTKSADVFKPKTRDGLFDVLPKEQQSEIARMKEFYVGEPIDQDILSMLRFLAESYKFIYVTSRPGGEVHDATRYWFVKNQLPYLTNLHIVDNGSKRSFVTGCKFFVDDRVDVALDLADVTTVITVDQPWNRHLDTPNRIKTIFDLPKFLEEHDG